MRYASHWPSLVPLLFLAVYLPTGIRPERGFRKLSAYIRGKVRGTRTPATVTSEGCSSFSLRGGRWVDVSALTGHRPVNSFTAPTSFTAATATRGSSGGQLERAA